MKPKLSNLVLFSLYAMIGLLIAGMALGIWFRAADTTWSQMSEVRWKYDALAVFVALYAIVVAAGLKLRRAWARVHAIGLCCVVFFSFPGIRIVGPLVMGMPLDADLILNKEALLMGGLALANIVGLTLPAFKQSYVSATSRNAAAPD